MKDRKSISIFLCGDVMTGRGIDQVLPHPSDPILYEPYVKNAKDYVQLAEDANGAIDKQVDFSYIWGDALEELERILPDLRIINLETAVTTSDDYWPGKGINYRMHPDNFGCITTAVIDCCTLANNHVLDWGYDGLLQTLETLKTASVKTTGAGRDLQEACKPAILELEEKGRVIVFSFGLNSSGIPFGWAATREKPGVNFLTDLSEKTAGQIGESAEKVKRKNDLLIASIHWGGNWGYKIPSEQIDFAHMLIDNARVDIVFGHSSHHVKAIEVYQEKPILYGCGDFINDYEGIGGYEEFRGELCMMYFVQMDGETKSLSSLKMIPMRIKNFKLNRVIKADTRWLKDTLTKEGERFGTALTLNPDNSMELRW